jgi:class 3 adenylate cyclase/tetratricopeptide (TPR) repeat protein
MAAEDLRPYLSRLQLRWQAERPERRWLEDDGTLLFFDVSGFTPLTERLATRGKAGGEELTDILTAVFTRLLAAAEALGGDTLKFGGDALLLRFAGPGHEARACAAAWDMQAAMRGYRRLRTTAGTIALGASTGVASGPLHTFLVGEQFRTLVVAGPTTSTTLAMEKAADAGEVLVSAGTAQALEARVLGDERGGGRLLRARPRADADGPPSTADERWLPLAPTGLPVALRPYLRHTADGEHRQAVVAFVQFAGVDELLEQEGPGAAAGALHDLLADVQAACDRHGVTFLDTDADIGAGKVFLASGAPVSSTEDEDRMLLALRDVVAPPRRLRVRAGVNRGRVFAVHLGAPWRRSYTTMGDATNLAARVMGKAPAGEVLATRAVLDRLRTPFHTEPVAPFAVKGKSQPVEGALVGAPEGWHRHEEAQRVVGRDRERAVLGGALAAAATGQGLVLELRGEPGIGKSALVRHAIGAARHAGFQVVTVEGGPYATTSPYHVLREPLRSLLADADAGDAAVTEALRTLLERADPGSLPWMSLLGIPFGLDLEPSAAVQRLDAESARARMHLATTALLAELLPARAALLVIDDAHWLDDASSALLEAVLEEAPSRGWVGLVSRRPGGAGLRAPAGAGPSVVELGPLEPDAALELAAPGDGPGELAPDVADAIRERANGNPLFLLELVAAARAGRDVAELPDSVESLLSARIDTLGPGDRVLLRRAAVLGMRFGRDLLGDMLDQPGPELLGTLRRLSVFLDHEASALVRFRLELARQAAYEALPFRGRRALHGRAGELIAARAGATPEELAPLLSLHFDAAARDAESWRWSRLAGERADRLGAPLEATVFYRRALHAGRRFGVPAGELVDVGRRLGDAAELGGMYDRAREAYRDARRLAGDDPPVLAELCRREGWLRERSGKFSDALRWYTRGLRTLAGIPAGGERDTELLRARLVLAGGAARMRQGRLTDALTRLQSAADAARALDDRPTLAHAAFLLDAVLTDLGRGGEGHSEEALRIYEELGDSTGQANVLNNLGVTAYFAGRWDEALALYERSRRAREEAGDVVRLGEAANNSAEILSDQGHIEEAEALLQSALRLWRAAAYPIGIGLATSNLGRAAARGGDIGRAGDLLARARERLEAIGAGSLALEAQARDAERLVLAARPAEALDVLRLARPRAASRDGAPVLLAMLDRLSGYALAQAGDLEAALRSLEDSLAVAVAAGATYEEAQTLEALARVAPLAGSEADGRGERAAALFGRLGVVRTWAPPLTAA